MKKWIFDKKNSNTGITNKLFYTSDKIIKDKGLL